MLTDDGDVQVEILNLTRAERLNNLSGSLGNQIKWKHNNLFVKLDCLGYESIAEVLTSNLLSFTNLNENEYVKYYSCIVYEDGVLLGSGCYSHDFTKGYDEVTVANILDNNLLSYAISYDDLRSELFSIVGFDVKPYIDKILSIDSITRNEDRHFKNISFLFNGEKYIPAPIFDNGDGCMSDEVTHPLSVNFEDNIKNCYAKPFRSSYKDNFVNNVPLIIDYDGFMSNLFLTGTRSLRALETIKYGLKEMEGISWVRK